MSNAQRRSPTGHSTESLYVPLAASFGALFDVILVVFWTHLSGWQVLSILRGEPAAPRGIGWMFDKPRLSVEKGYGYRYGKWKYVQGSVSCSGPLANTTCQLPMLYDLETDLGERNDVQRAVPGWCQRAVPG